MKTTIYELLGMIKDGKAPKKIKFDDIIWELTPTQTEYYNDNEKVFLFTEYSASRILNNEVEILEDNKKIEKIDVAWQNVFDEQAQQDFAKMTLNKINEIIDYINKEE